MQPDSPSCPSLSLLSLQVEQSVARALFLKEAAQNTTRFDWRNFEDADMRRRFSKIADIGTAALPKEKIERVRDATGVGSFWWFSHW